jgi:PLP dependent protein
MTDIAGNLRGVLARVAAAAERCDRETDAVTVVAVSKTRSAEEIAAAASCGVRDFGENYVQELVGKAEALRDRAGGAPRWHFIGHLQRNKAKVIAGLGCLVHSVDSPRLAAELDQRAAEAGRPQAILIQVDLAGEATKTGCPEDQLHGLVEAVSGQQHLDWQGLMTIAPLAETAEASRPYYRRLVAIRQQLLEQGVPAANLRHLSMGMSNDYEVAIEEGATLVRVGTAIFGPRH